MTKVKKRNGNEEELSREKIRASIEKAFEDAGEKTKDYRQEIERMSEDAVKKAENTKDTTTAHVRETILADLDKVNKAAADAWRSFDRKVKGRT